MATTTQTIKKTASKVATKAKEAAVKTGEYVKENPQQAGYLLIGVLAIGAIYLVFKTANSAGNKVEEIFNGDPDISDNVQIKDVPTPKATISNERATYLASQLLDAMNAKQPIYGTDEDTIEAVFDVISNADDFMKVFKAFDLKDYNGNNSPPTGIWSNLDSYKKQHLVYWLYSELEPSDGEVYKKVKSRVESAGFVFGKKQNP